MKQSLLGVVLLALVLSSVMHAQVVLPDRESDPAMRRDVFGLGLAAGPATGIGLSFRHHLPSTFSYQLTGGIIKVDKKLSYSIGGEGQFDLVRSGGARFFAAGGIGYYYSGSSNENEMAGPGRVGLGIGGEFWANSGLHGCVELMFTYFTDGTVLPLPQFGIHYYFF
jgi:opacity protein-like surface antigen